MIKLVKGEVYECARFRSGVSERGRWEIVTVMEEGRYGKTQQEITIFPMIAPSGLYEGCQFRIKEIVGVARKKKKDKEGNWTMVDVCVDANVELIKDELNLDGDLPFTFGAYDDDDDPMAGETVEDLLLS